MTENTTDIRAVGYSENLPVDNPRSLIDTRIARPKLRPHDLLVQVEAVSVNPVDVKQRAHSQPSQGVRVLGYDAAGTVVATGTEVTLFEPGDHVYYAGALNRSGSNAELHAVDERIVGRKPASLNFADAAALPLTTITAWEALFDKLRLTATSHGTLLIVGAAGGVGSIMIQLAKHLLPNVRVIGTASREESSAWVMELGADDVVDHSGDLAANVLEVAPDGVDWIFTSASSQPGAVPAYVRVTKPFGAIVAIDDPRNLDVVALKGKSLSWHWEFMFARSVHQTEDMIEQHRLLNAVAELVDEGKIRTTATTRLTPIDARSLREAHGLVETGRAVGKVVVSRA